MIQVARRKGVPDLPCYRRKKHKGLKRFQYRYKGEELSDAEYEAKIASDHYGVDANYEIKDGHRQLNSKGKKFDFWVYSGSSKKTIQKELKRVFRGKCAYCEYEINIRDDFDIEHFRPKKAVEHSTTRELKEPAYYWLAADWHNLMPSCPYCNQERKHEIVGETGMITLGKKNQFPLSDESKRLSQPSQKIEEEEDYRLLINPCVDRPEEHLYFVTDNGDEELGEVKPESRDGELDPKGKVSMFVYALNSKAIVDKRRKHALDVIKILQRLIDQTKKYSKALEKESEFADDFRDNLIETIQDLREKLDAHAMFLGLTRQLIRDYGIRFGQLKKLGIDPMEMVKSSIKATTQFSDSPDRV